MFSRLSTIFLTATLAFAQAPTPPDPATQAQMRVNMLASQLTLTDAQKTSALTIFTNAYTSMQTIQTSMRTARQSLNDAIQKNDTAAIDQASATVGTLTGQLTAIDGKANAAFYVLLTSAQQTVYNSMPHGMGPGGPGGPGGMRPAMRGGGN